MISEGLAKIETALNSKPQMYFPFDKDSRRAENLQLAHDIGFGLGMYEDWRTWAGTTYPRFVVLNSLDSIGVVLSAGEWMSSIEEGVADYRTQYGIYPM